MPKLLLEGKNDFYQLKTPTSIGRSSKCDITISDHRSSRKHCELEKDEKGYFVRDLNSFNGTFVNDKRITFSYLQPQDKIRIGNTCFIFSTEEGSPLGQTFLLLEENGKWQHRIALKQGKNRIGRKAENDICISDRQISSFHAELTCSGEGFILRDLDSTNGTWADHQKVKNEEVSVQVGSVLRFGNSRCLLWQQDKEKSWPQKKRALPAQQPKVMLWSTLIVLAMLGIFVAIVAFPLSIAEMEKVPGNLIRDYSFEENFAWQWQEGISWQEGKAYQGDAFLRFSSHEKENVQSESEIKYWEAIPLIYGKAYEMSFYTRYQNLQGIAGLRILWLHDEEQGYQQEDYIAIPLGNSSGWQKIEKILRPPRLAKKMRLSFVFIGKADKVDIENVVLLERDKSVAPKPPKITGQNWQMEINERGMLNIYRNSQLYFGSGRVLLWKGEQLIATQSFAQGKAVEHKGALIWQGVLISFDSQQIPWQLKCTTSDQEGITIDFTPSLEKLDSPEKYRWEYAWNLYQPQLLENIRVVGQEVEKLSGTFSKEKVNQIIWSQQRPFGMIFSSPLFAEIIQSGELAFLKQKISSPNNFQMKFRGDLLQEQRELMRVIEKAQQLEADNKWGLAYQRYQKAMNDFLLQEELVVPQEKIAWLSKKYHQEFARLSELLKQARFFHCLPLYQNALSEYQDALEKWQGMPEREKLQQRLENLRQEMTEIQEVSHLQQARKLNQRAENFFNEKQHHLAYLFYQEIVKRFPQTEYAKLAKEKIFQIQDTFEGKEK